MLWKVRGSNSLPILKRGEPPKNQRCPENERQAQKDNRLRTEMSALWPRRANALAAVSPVEAQLALASQLIRAITN